MTATAEKPCYFVTANDAGGWCRAGGHYIASNPQEAIALFRAAQDGNPHVADDWSTGLTFKAKRSKARHNAMNSFAA
jgi:hypothetical protein